MAKTMQKTTQSTAPALFFINNNPVPNNQQAMNNTFAQNAYNCVGLKVTGVPVSQMVIDTENYQRPSGRKVQQIADNWDIQKCGFISVFYDDGIFYVIDGGNRVAAARLIGIGTLPCLLIDAKTKKEAASFFAHQDDNRTKVSKFYTIRAKAFADEEDAVAVYNICAAHKIIIEKSAVNTTGRLTSIDIAERIYAQYGADGLNWVFDVIKDSGWHNVSGAYGKAFLGALISIYSNRKDHLPYTRDQLAKILKHIDFKFVLDQAVAAYPGREQRFALTAYLEQRLNEPASDMVHPYGIVRAI